MTETDTDDRWYVQFDSAEVRLMTLDEIQEAFEAGLIHPNTYLIEVGKSDWQTLADVAGLGDEEESEDASEAEATPLPVAAPQSTYPQAQAAQQSPQAYTMPQGHGQSQAIPPRLPTTAPPAYPQAANAAPGGGWPPVAQTRAATHSSPPVAQTALQSTIPVVQDVGFDLDLDPSSFKSGKRNLFLFAAAAVAVIGGGGFALTRLDMPETPSAAAASLPAAPMPTPARPATPTPPTNTENAAAPSAPASDSKSESATKSGSLSEDMKQALLAQDKERTQKKKSRAAASSGKRRASASSTGTVLKGGGGADDPLDPSL